jgi:capsular exopolysaccharide synthesis family protein
MNASSSTPITPVAAEDEIDLGQLFRTVWRGKWWIILTAILGLLIGGYYAFAIATPLYTTTAAVVQETEQEPVVDFSGGLGGGLGGTDQSSINTEIEVLRSRGLLEKLVAELTLIQDPEFNSALRPDPAISIGIAIQFVKEKLGLPISPAKELNAQETLDAVVDSLRSVLSVSNIRQSYVYNLTATTEDPEKSARLINTLAELYILNQLDVKSEANLAATEWLTNRVSQLRIDLENAESSVKDFNARTDLINADTLAALSRQVKELRERLDSVRSSEAETAAQLALLQATASSDDPQLMTEVADDRVLNGLFSSLSTNPIAGRSIFDARFAQVIAQTELELRREQVQITALEQSIQQQEEATDQQSDDLVELQQLQREAEASGLLYEYFLSRLKEISVQSGIQTPDSRVLSRAVVPQSPSAPRKPIILALSLILGAFVGIAFVLLREMTQNTFRAADELEQRTGYTVLGQIPKIPARRRNKILQYLTDKPTSAASEAVRNMRTSVLLSDVDNPPKVIMSTSSIPGEGKTTQSLALAQNLAGLGKKVLLVEGDVRKRIFAEYFSIENKHGLMAVLEGEVEPEDAVVYRENLNADVLMSEKPSSNAADIFSSQAFVRFVAKMRETYDYIVIDTPPVLAVPDARIIGKLVDATIYTVRWDHTTHRQVAEGLKSFASVKVKITGLVLGQIDMKGQKKYGNDGGAGYYGSYHDN